MPTSPHTSKPTLIVLGTGFGGFSLIKTLPPDLFRVIVVSPKNHFLFTPLLPSTTVGTIEFRSIVEPVRAARPEVEFVQAYAVGLDHKRKVLRCQSALEKKSIALSYDYLVIAVGARPATYGIPGVLEHAIFLKELVDARLIRQKIIECLEMASHPSILEKERRRLLNFVVVGGGPTGVEFAAEMHDFITEDLRRSYHSLMHDVHITLLEAGDNILSTFDAVLSQYTTRFFRRQHIDIRTHSRVVRIAKDHVLRSDAKKIPYGMIVWTTGIGPTKFVSTLKLPKDRLSRLEVDEHLRVQGTSQLFAVGDCISIAGKNIPATAQVAQQEGTYLGRVLPKYLESKPVKPFMYKHYGMLAYIGGGRALADLDSFKGRGFATWLFWRSVYITRLMSLKNKILVLFDWVKTFVFGRDISRF